MASPILTPDSESASLLASFGHFAAKTSAKDVYLSELRSADLEGLFKLQKNSLRGWKNTLKNQSSKTPRLEAGGQN